MHTKEMLFHQAVPFKSWANLCSFWQNMSSLCLGYSLYQYSLKIHQYVLGCPSSPVLTDLINSLDIEIKIAL